MKPTPCAECGAKHGHYFTCSQWAAALMAAASDASAVVESPAVPTATGSPAGTPGPFAVPLTLAGLRLANASRAPRWRRGGPPSSLEYALMELGGEVGEAQNAAKKLIRFRNGWAGGSDARENLAEELADTVICADLAAMKEGIDLGAAVVAKFNATSDKYGFPERLALAPQTTESVDRLNGAAPRLSPELAESLDELAAALPQGKRAARRPSLVAWAVAAIGGALDWYRAGRKAVTQ